MEPKAFISSSLGLKPYSPRAYIWFLGLPVSSFFTFGTVSCCFMLDHVLKTLKEYILSSISMGLEQALGLPTAVDTVIHGPETPSLKDLLTQLLAALSVESLQLSAPSGIASAVESHLVQGHVLFPGRPTSSDGFMWEYKAGPSWPNSALFKEPF